MVVTSVALEDVLEQLVIRFVSQKAISARCVQDYNGRTKRCKLPVATLMPTPEDG